jgi:DNA-binding GntR family transcriptional regulator
MRYDRIYDARMSAAADGTFLTGSVGAIPLRTAAVLDAIKHAILAGERRPGQSLVEAELAQRLGVSKTPVREALKTLAGAGLVTMSPYRGATVRAIDADTARAIYDMRLLLEPEAVRRAVQRAQDGPAGSPGPAGLAAARAALDRADASAGEADRSLANREFHRALYLDCGNPLLVGVLDDLRDQTALVSAAAWQREPSWRQEAGEHRAILAAATAGDADHAARLLAAHIGSFAARHFPGPGPGPSPGRGPSPGTA